MLEKICIFSSISVENDCLCRSKTLLSAFMARIEKLHPKLPILGFPLWKKSEQ